MSQDFSQHLGDHNRDDYGCSPHPQTRRARRLRRLDGVRSSDSDLPDVALKSSHRRSSPHRAAQCCHRAVIDARLAGNSGLLQSRVLAAYDGNAISGRLDESCLVAAQYKLAEESVGLEYLNC